MYYRGTHNYRCGSRYHSRYRLILRKMWVITHWTISGLTGANSVKSLSSLHCKFGNLKVISLSTNVHLKTSILVLSLTNTGENVGNNTLDNLCSHGCKFRKITIAILVNLKLLFTLSVNVHVVVDCNFTSTKLSVN